MRPSPYVILNDFGGAFSMGVIGGGIWHGIKGARNSPKVGHHAASVCFTVLPSKIEDIAYRDPFRAVDTDLDCRENE